ncbi:MULTISPECIES: PqqD family peptide modification chaperone [unclassified Minwuia]|jgi:Coenzyme PQQ synthesis protein D (PqqD)|uniref:PqqD family peptide modification chaperone n=1 Tax=unclassified Minwuia TaxID=2618799 RepID=UPI00247B15B2|nr:MULTISPECIES: PqqD family peptide modification chaperone [unclassified Minwuia]
MTAPTYRRLEGFVSTDMDGETVLMSIEHGSYFGIGGTGSLIWERLEQPQTEYALVEAVRVAYDVSEEDCRRDVAAFLATLIENGLAEAK